MKFISPDSVVYDVSSIDTLVSALPHYFRTTEKLHLRLLVKGTFSSYKGWTYEESSSET